ncbi:MAG: hypothetical protein P4L84_34490 [Isosphaeraceae bacterium]|nr:hypothetical protein [Isosphaeraceae bacterium]
MAFGVIAVAGLARVVAFLFYVGCQFTAPREVFPLEAKMVHLAWRVQHGVRLYPPWVDGPHVANFFGPCYFVLVGLLGRATGADLDGLVPIARAVTVASVLGMTVLLGLYAARKYGTGAGLLAAVVSLGSGPLIGFGVMARPDALADVLGFMGFLLATSRLRGQVAVGCVLLLVAIFTKQTAVIYLAAAVLAQFLMGRHVAAAAVAVSVVLTTLAIVAVVTLAIEPGFGPGLLGESRSPWDGLAYRALLVRLSRTSLDLPVCAGLGMLFWCARPTRDLRFAALAATLITACFVASVKKGADLNYFLPLRAVASLAVATLWSAMKGANGCRAWRLAAAATVAAAALSTTLLPIAVQTYVAYEFREWLHTRNAQVLLRQYADLVKLARDPSRSILTDSGHLDIQRGTGTVFADPWLFRLLASTERLNPVDLQRAIENERYDWIVTTKPLEDPEYATYEFGLPNPLAAAARRHYVFAGQKADLFVYQPRNGQSTRGTQSKAK